MKFNANIEAETDRNKDKVHANIYKQKMRTEPRQRKSRLSGLTNDKIKQQLKDNDVRLVFESFMVLW